MHSACMLRHKCRICEGREWISYDVAYNCGRITLGSLKMALLRRRNMQERVAVLNIWLKNAFRWFFFHHTI
jgi:hypothetical protein